MRHAVTTLLLFALVGLRASVRADPPADFLTLARNAIADPATLARVHSLYIVSAPRRLGSAGGNMPRVDRSIGRGPGPAPLVMWLAPPSRYLVRTGRGSRGFDGARLIAIGVDPDVFPQFRTDLTTAFREAALTLLLYDPAALGVVVHDLGTSQVGKKPFHVLDVTASDFDTRLYFDPTSHRLTMSDSPAWGTAFMIGGGPGGMPPPPIPPPGAAIPLSVRITYGDYRRVDGVDLPFYFLRTTTGGTGGARTTVTDVIKYVINPGDLNQQFGTGR